MILIIITKINLNYKNKLVSEDKIVVSKLDVLVIVVPFVYKKNKWPRKNKISILNIVF